MRLRDGHQHSQFWPILAVSWTITDCFGFPDLFPRLMNPGARLRVVHKYSQFWPILASFVDYYSLFWGPGVISMIDEPRGASTCQSPTLTILADSGTFSALLLTVVGSRSDFHD